MSSYTRHDITKSCAFWGMVISGFAYLLSGILKVSNAMLARVWPQLAGFFASLVSILTFIGNIAIILAIAIPAWQVVAYRSKGWKIVYWIAFVGFALGSVLGLLGSLGIFG